jgi:hypothetical protein
MSHIYEGKQSVAHMQPATCGHMRRIPFRPSLLPADLYRRILRLFLPDINVGFNIHTQRAISLSIPKSNLSYVHTPSLKYLRV